MLSKLKFDKLGFGINTTKVSHLGVGGADVIIC